MDIKSIIRKVLNEIENKNIRKAYDLSDIPVEDDDTGTSELMKSLLFRPINKYDLKAWILRKVITEGPNADLNAVNLERITNMSWLFSCCDKINYVSPSDTVTGNTFILHNINICHYIPYSDLRTMPRRSDLGLNGEWQLDADQLYNDVKSIFDHMNPDISEWHVDKVVNMDYMFTKNCGFNCDISGWHVDNVKTMVGMFWYASSFNQDISSWNINNCLNCFRYRMFASCPIEQKNRPHIQE